MNLMMLFIIFMFTLKLQTTDALCSRKNVDSNNCDGTTTREDSFDKLMNYLIKGPLSGQAWEWLAEICDDYGHRMSGSAAEEKVLDHIAAEARKDGFQNVHTEEVQGIPNFKRGNDMVTVIEPREMSLHVLAIPGTPPGTVQAEAVVVTTEEEFEKTDVSGKIVVIVPVWTNYSTMVRARYSAFYVQQKGGVGMLVKSITPFSLATLHTGRGYSIHNVTIPSASLTLEEAEMMLRWYNKGKQITIKMEIESKTLPNPLKSKNLIFDIKGSQFPLQVVVLSAHVDSWDVGQGALDDGGGCASIYFALKAILELSKIDCRFRPIRTLRGIFWTGAEQKFIGGKQYFKNHWKRGRGQCIEDFFFVSETDEGAFKPRNYNSTLNFKGTEPQMRTIKQIVTKMNTYGIPLSTKFLDYQGDVQDFADNGVPSVGYTSDRGSEWYYYFHHSDADYMNAIEKEDLDYTAAIFAVLAHFIGYIPDWPST